MRLAIYSGNNFKETFTRAHAEFLQPEWLISGMPIPTTINSVPLLKKDLFARLRRILIARSNPNYNFLEEEFVSFLRKEKPDVLFVEYGTSAANVLPACKRAHIPMSVGFYGFDAFTHDVKERYKESYQELFEYGKSFLAQSESIKRELISMGCKAEKIFVNACPPHNNFLKITPSNNEKIILSIGRFVDKKAPFYTLFAFAEIIKVHPDARLIMAGDGPLLNTCKELSIYLDISKNVEFIGIINREQQIDLFKKTSVFVQHSITALNGDREGAPVAVMEAGMAGIPVVSTLHSGIPEIVTDGVTGFLVEERDVQKMADRIKRILDNPSLAEEMGSKAKKYVSEKFNMDKHISELKTMLINSIEK